MTMVRLGLALVVLIAVLVTSTWLGNVSAYVAMIAALLSLPALVDGAARRAALANPGLQMFAAAFALLVAAFAGSAQQWGDLAATGDFVVLLLTFPVFALIHGLGPRFTLGHFSALALLGAAVSAGVSLYEVYWAGIGRSAGLYSSSIFMGNIGVLLGLFAGIGFWAMRSRWRWLCLLGPVFGVVAAVLSGTRASLLAFAAMSLAVAVLVFWREPKARRALGLIMVCGVAFVAVAVAVLGARMGLSQRFAEVVDLLTTGKTADLSINMRLDFYGAGLHAFLDAPIFGHGWWRRFAAAMPYMPEEAIAAGSGASYAHLHNEVLTFASGMGLFGVAAYLLLALAPAVGVLRLARGRADLPLVAAAIGLTTGMLAMGVVDSMLIFELPKTFFCFTAAMLLALAARQRPAG